MVNFCKQMLPMVGKQNLEFCCNCSVIKFTFAQSITPLV